MSQSSAHNKPTTAINNSGADRQELKQAIRAASRWYAQLRSPDATPEDREQWRAWVQQNSLHQTAWDQIERIQTGFDAVSKDVALPALRGAALSRRDLLRRLGVVVVAAPVGLAAWKAQPWLGQQAQYTTATGERQSLTLPDGGTLVLNTATQVDVRYGQAERRIKLHSGEILIETAPDQQDPARPLVVHTPHGQIEALGTRFIVHTTTEHTEVTVQDKVVNIRPASGGPAQRLESGQRLKFRSDNLGNVSMADPNPGSWLYGSLMVVDMPLRDLLVELGRYRKGMLTCSDDIAHLKISGAFPVDNTDRALAAITRAFPVKEMRLTRYWVRLTGA
jgi:transmembrane sensor